MNKQDIFGRGKENGYNNKTGDIKEKQILDRQAFWLPLILGFLSSILASTGLWALIQNRLDRKDAKAKMLKGLGHDRIMDLGKKYIKRGYITPDEYENFVDYLYVPYEALHGNGSAKRIVEEVKRLPIRDTPINGKRSQKPKD